MKNITKWEFVKNPMFKEYDVYKDGKQVCYLEIHKVNLTNSTWYEIRHLGEKRAIGRYTDDAETFKYLKDAKAYIKENY